MHLSVGGDTFGGILNLADGQVIHIDSTKSVVRDLKLTRRRRVGQATTVPLHQDAAQYCTMFLDADKSFHKYWGGTTGLESEKSARTIAKMIDLAHAAGAVLADARNLNGRLGISIAGAQVYLSLNMCGRRANTSFLNGDFVVADEDLNRRITIGVYRVYGVVLLVDLRHTSSLFFNTCFIRRNFR